MTNKKTKSVKNETKCFNKGNIKVCSSLDDKLLVSIRETDLVLNLNRDIEGKISSLFFDSENLKKIFGNRNITSLDLKKIKKIALSF